MPAFMLQDDEEDCPWWMRKLIAANFDKTCARDRVCKTCGGAPFCDHCCGEHHRDHHTASARPARPARGVNGLAVPKEAHRRDSFCIDCGVGFCSNLCEHHAGHEVIPIDAYGDRHFVRSTGSESWFIASTFDGIETFEDKDGNLMVPLERKRSILPEPGLRYRYDTTPPIAPHQMDEAMEVSVGN
ncbi:uncharacterized protein LOC124647257 [Lolium rigidum]|uniref:uncharacterized protein LOC124647257 n=1 Tax=Lolium rigidum TaxID=89674 RepID=UPI001F5C5BE7|nr:uncharacterized protein LOC124647257 [Lolium rigidum]